MVLARHGEELIVILSTGSQNPTQLIYCAANRFDISSMVLCGVGVFAGLECLDDLGDADDDEADAGGQGEHGDGVEGPYQHHQAGDHRDDAGDDVSAAAGQVAFADAGGYP